MDSCICLRFICIYILIIIIIISTNLFIKKESFTNNITIFEKNCIDTYFDKIVCIVMPNRKLHMKNTFLQWGIKNVEYFDAINKSEYTHQSFINNNLLSSNYSSYLNLGRICCHVSALLVYQNFINSDAQNIIIFEDDLYKDEYKNMSDFNKKIKPYLLNIPSNWNYLNFGKCSDYCNLSINTNKYWSIPARPLCRTAIALTKTAAKSIVKYTSFMQQKSGDHMISDLIQDKKFIAYSSNKQLFKQDRPQFGSNLNNNNLNSLTMCKDK